MPERTCPIYFIRHGIAEHNVANINLTDPRYIDAILTNDGERQVTQMAQLLRHHLHKNNQILGMVLVSPLRRCLQTAKAIVRSYSGTEVLGK